MIKYALLARNKEEDDKYMYYSVDNRYVDVSLWYSAKLYDSVEYMLSKGNIVQFSINSVMDSYKRHPSVLRQKKMNTVLKEDKKISYKDVDMSNDTIKIQKIKIDDNSMVMCGFVSNDEMWQIYKKLYEQSNKILNK